MPRFFILLTKQELNIYMLPETSSEITTFKTLFSSSLAIYFCLDIIYCTSVLLWINILTLPIIKQISDWNAILIYSRYFLDCLRPRLTKAKDTKGVNIISVYIESLSIGKISTRLFLLQMLLLVLVKNFFA